MDELHYRCKLDGIAALGAATLGAQQCQQGAQALTTRIYDVVANVFHHRHIRFQVGDDQLVDGVQLSLYRFTNVLHVGCRIEAGGHATVSAYSLSI